jgi:hypothetical protein
METTTETNTDSAPATHRGACHCGAVRFEVTANLAAGGGRCNCSICVRTSVLSGLVQPAAFTLLAGEDNLAYYEWGAKISRRFFCKTCGIHCFGRGFLPELGGHYVAVNYNCLEDVEVADVPVTYWDGRHDNWEAGPRATPWPIGVTARVVEN